MSISCTLTEVGTAADASTSWSTHSYPIGDVSTTGWTSTGATGYGAINEVTENDSTYITSPPLGTGSPFIDLLDEILPAGTYTANVGAEYTGTSGQVRVSLLDNSLTVVGASAWQAVTSSFAAYTLSITTTAPAYNIQIEVSA